MSARSVTKGGPFDAVMAQLLDIRTAHAAGRLVPRLREISEVYKNETDKIVLAAAHAQVQRDLEAIGWPNAAKMAAAVFDRRPASLNDAGPDAGVEIDAGDRDLPHIAAQAWDAVKRANDPPRLFRVGTMPARLDFGDGEALPGTQPLTIDRLRHELARMATFFHVDQKERRPAIPPDHLVRDMLAHPDPPLPVLRRIVSAPFFTAAGAMVVRPGYDPSGIYYAPSPGLEKLPAVAVTPTAEEQRRAKELITNELLPDFKFVTPSDRAHAIAVLLLPFVRDLIDGPTPLHGFDKPSPGTGAGLLCKVLVLPALGREPAVMAAGRDEDEWRKRIFAALVSRSPIVLIDNVRRRLDAEALAAVLTTQEMRDRPMRASELVTVPNRAAWMATGNNLTFSNEIARRTVRVRMDTKLERPAERDPSTFRHALPKWAHDHRAELVWAALTLVRAWLAAGRPKGSEVLGSFESWSYVIGGIFDVAGIEGFLGNVRELYQQSDVEGAEHRRLIAAWWEKFGAAEVGVRELHEIALDDRVGLPLTDKSVQAQKVQLGQRLKSLSDRRFRIPSAAGGEIEVRLEGAGEHQRALVWRLRPVESNTVRDSPRLTRLPETAAKPVSPVSGGESGTAITHGEGCACSTCVPPGTEDLRFP